MCSLSRLTLLNRMYFVHEKICKVLGLRDPVRYKYTICCGFIPGLDWLTEERDLLVPGFVSSSFHRQITFTIIFTKNWTGLYFAGSGRLPTMPNLPIFELQCLVLISTSEWANEPLEPLKTLYKSIISNITVVVAKVRCVLVVFYEIKHFSVMN